MWETVACEFIGVRHREIRVVVYRCFVGGMIADSPANGHRLMVPALGHVSPLDWDNSVTEIGVECFEGRRRHIQ